MKRRRFLSVGFTGAMAVAIGAQAKYVSDLMADGESTTAPVYDLLISDAIVEMVDLEPVYFWTFADESGAHLPGPTLHALEGDQVELRITNTLDEPHAFAVHDTGITTGPIPPGESRSLTFTAPQAGTYIYLDPLNAPFNRALGLNGVLVVMPREGSTPFTNPPPTLQRLFDDLGTAAHFPGEPWRHERTRIWHVHSVDLRWHELAANGGTGGSAPGGVATAYYTLNGQSGFFASHNPQNAPVGRIGHPHLIRIVNTGMYANSLHIHGNHIYLCSENGVSASNVRSIDSWRVGPLGRADWLLPAIRPPDICGPEDRPLRDVMAEELGYRDDYGLPQCPLEYPMHCHMEPSQTARGGNYPGGLVTHWAITGDLDMDFADAGFDCAPTPALTASPGHLGDTHA